MHRILINFYEGASVLHCHIFVAAYTVCTSSPSLLPFMTHTEAALVYARELGRRGYGEPLWQPEPTQYGEVLIGDVGFFVDGSFIRVLNCTLPEDHPSCTLLADNPVNAGLMVPSEYPPLEYNKQTLLQTNENYLPPQPICSKSISQSEVDVGAAG